MSETLCEDFIVSKPCCYMIRSTSDADTQGISEGAVSRKNTVLFSLRDVKIFTHGFEVA